MSVIEPEDIAKLEEKQKTTKIFQVEEIEAINFDENGQENGTWKGFSVTKIDDPVNYCFDCRDKLNADRLCDFLNNECYIDADSAIDSFVLDNCIEWSNLITELSYKETQLLELKDIIFDKEQWIIENTDFKQVYGKNNSDIRKSHLLKHMAGEYTNRRNLELSIDYLKRRIIYLKQLVPVKTALLEAKTHE